MSALLVYGDSISGNCLKVKWTAAYLNVPFDWRETSVRERETRRESFLALNPAGQVPYVVLEDGRGLAQSNAIILHLAERAGAALIPADGFARAKMSEWLFWEHYSHETAIAVRRFLVGILSRRDDEVDPALKTKGDAALALMEKTLGAQDFLLTDGLSLADVALVAYTRVADEGGFDLGAYPGVSAWIDRVAGVLSIDPAEGRLH